MTAPISNGPTTTRLHHYAGHYCIKGFARRIKGYRAGEQLVLDHHTSAGGFSLHEGATRRRHAAKGLRVEKNPRAPTERNAKPTA